MRNSKFEVAKLVQSVFIYSFSNLHVVYRITTILLFSVWIKPLNIINISKDLLLYSGSWWWTRSPGVLRVMGSQRVGHDWATELNWTELNTFWAQNKRPYLRALVPLPSLYMGCTCLVIRDLSSVATGGELTHPSSLILHFWDSHRTPAPVNRFLFK